MNYFYSIYNRISNKSYIGKSINPYYRYKVHMKKLRNGSHHNIKLQNSFNKHGENAFELIILYETDDSNWDKYEVALIKLFQTQNDSFGYNIGRGGESNMITDEIQEKQKQSNKDRVDNIFQIDMNTLSIISKFESSIEAQMQTGVANTHILDCCKHKYISSGGYYWCFEKYYNKSRL